MTPMAPITAAATGSAGSTGTCSRWWNGETSSTHRGDQGNP